MELSREGQATHHRLWMYDVSHVGGQSAIVSLRLNDQTRVTVEIDPQRETIRQERCLQNRPADAKETRIIQLWLD